MATLGRRLTPARMVRLLLLVALGVAGYATFQLAPGWLQLLPGRETALLRRQSATLFVDALLIAYPLALVGSALGAVLLTCLRMRARSRRRREGFRTSSRSPLQARLLLLCSSTLLSLAVFEAGASAWRSRLNRSPDLPAVAASPKQPVRVIGLFPMKPEILSSPADSRARKRLLRARLDPCEFS
jgi:hypothetical protein